MIYLKNVSLAFGERTLFENWTWPITERSRIGLVGDNGAGKTTLLKAILGMVELDGGTIDIPDRKNRTISYLPQDLLEIEPVPLMEYLKNRCGLTALESGMRNCEKQVAALPAHPSEGEGEGEGEEEGLSENGARREKLLREYDRIVAVYQAKEGYAFEARAKQVLKGFGFGEQDFLKQCDEFSGGWKMRILLAVILLSQPDIMLLDEPTNHLDTESMEWLESYLKDYPGMLITVAHDRFFLDKMATTIAEISQGRLALYKGNYSYYLVEKEKRLAALEKERLLQQGEIKKTEEFIERFRFKATKAKQVQSRIRMLEKFAPLQAEGHGKTVKIRFPAGPKSGKEVLFVSKLAKSYGTQEIFRGVSFSLQRGERVALVGVNGSGKSTLSRILGQVEAPSAGEIRSGLNVHMAFFSQESAENLCYERTVWEETMEVASRSNDRERRNLLGAFLFSGDDIHKPVSVLSGGEKSRLALLKILLQETNLLILDEPTNHLDFKTKDIFQNALLSYQGTVVLVSHDRYFLDNLVNRVFELRDGGCIEYPGNYSYFIEKRQSLAEERRTAAGQHGPPPDNPAAEGKSAYRTREDKRREAEERQRLAKINQGLKKELHAIEKGIAALEGRKAEGELFLCDPLSHREPERIKQTHRDLKDLEREIEQSYDRWHELTMAMEDNILS
ncbi:MAG: ATP-binding cassette domain-containing protein [Syntrophales bacterium]